MSAKSVVAPSNPAPARNGLGVPRGISPPTETTPRRRSLSARVYGLAQIIPVGILAVVTFYEVSAHLILETKVHPLMFAFETIVFGLIGPAFTWATMNWVAHEIQQRERAEGEKDELNAMMQEMHHRIKNNLQTVADLLSLEMSRNPRPEVHESLRDSIMRIKSIAASHEILSVESVGSTDVRELAQLVCDQAKRSMLRPDQKIEIRVKGPAVYLTSKQATAFALVLNELISNSLEHGFRDRTHGVIEVEMDWDGAEVWIRVQDDGAGLPAGFELATSRGLGLQIARTLVEKDLHGKLALTANADNDEHGTTAWVLFQRGIAIGNGG